MESAASGLRHRLQHALRRTGEQHRQLREFHADVRQAVASAEPGDTRERFHRYRTALGAHFALEDDVLFPALHGLHPDRAPELERLGGEHAGLRDALGRLAALLDHDALAPFAAGFESLCATLAAHEAQEETLVSRLTAAAPAG